MNKHSCAKTYMVVWYSCRTAEDIAFHTD